jgi:hypothetical protein
MFIIIILYIIGDFASILIIIKINNLYKTLDREYIEGVIIYYFGVELKEK